MNINLVEIATYFIIYSFLGWVMESIVRSLCERKLINTGFLRGPFCPIYGIGATIMFLFLGEFAKRPVLLFFIAIIILTAWEYAVGIFLEKAFHTKYWDYSDHKINFQGRICLTNSICWGVLGILFVNYIHPFVQKVLGMIDVNLLNYTMAIFFVVFIADTITTIIHVKNIKATLENIENINKEIKEKIKEIRNKTSTTENMQQMIEKLKKKRNRTILHLYKNVYRLKKAFPAINTNEITEILNQKIEIRKKRIKNKEKDLK